MRNGWMSARDIKRVEIVVYGIMTIAAIFSFRSRKVGDSFHMSEKQNFFADIKSVMEKE